MRIIFAALAVLLVSTHSNAQTEESGDTHLLLRTSLLAPLESDANVMLGVGVQWNNRLAAIVDGGYIFANSYENNSRVASERNRVNGLKLRTEFRYYFQDIKYSKEATFYIAPVFHYKRVVSTLSEEFGINCVNGNCDYFQIDTYKRIKQELGGMITVGSHSPLFGSDRVALETFIGLGVKVKKFRNTDFTPGSTLFNQPDAGVFSFDRDGEFPMFPIGCKISVRLF
ncbi:MAG: hypothetical protein EOO09_17370 [Chitinophagaceae bacterium]|nr:MAG: hypothetical protein EOO09_17370 [Chitinophagaceae bacterium]